MANIYRMYADGGSRGNPGHAAYGAVIYKIVDGQEVHVADKTEYLGHATNNIAEYSGLVAGLKYIRDLDPKAEIEVRMDSELVVKQMRLEYNVKNEGLAKLFLKAKNLENSGSGRVHYHHIPRARNSAADALVNATLDKN